MADMHDPAASGAGAGAPGAAAAGAAGATQGPPSDAEMQAAYEAELNRITSTEMILQSTVSLLNIGGRRLGLGAPPEAAGASGAPQRDFEQVRDAIDAVKALMPVLERRMAGELGPLRDAISQLQMAYARESAGAAAAPGQSVPGQAAASEAAPGQGAPGQEATSASAAPAERTPPDAAEPASQEGAQQDKEAPGPAEASGRLWVPGR